MAWELEGNIQGLGVDDIILIPPIGCKAVKNVGTQAIPDNAHTAVTFNAEEFDDGDFHSIAAETSKMVITETGRYTIGGQAELAGATNLWSAAANYFAFISIWKNGVNTGTRLAQAGPLINASVTTPHRIPVGPVTVDLVEGDFVELAVFQTQNNVARNVNSGVGGTWLSIERVIVGHGIPLLPLDGSSPMTGMLVAPGALFDGSDPLPINGITAALAIDMPDDVVNAVVIKVNRPSSAVYGTGQVSVVLSDSDADATDVAETVKVAITGVTNTTPVQINCAAAHGASTGDNLRVTGTGIAALDLKWWKVTVVDADSVTLQGSVASGAAAAGYLYGNRSSLLARDDEDGSYGTVGGVHVATGLRGNSGQVIGAIGSGYGVHIDPSHDVTGLIIDNPDPTEWIPATVSDFLKIRDTRSDPDRDLVRVDANGAVVIRPKAGIAANTPLFRVRDDADNADLFYVDNEGDVSALKDVIAHAGLATQVFFGSTFGVAGIGFGANDTHIMRIGAGNLFMSQTMDMPEVASPASPAANRGRIFMKDNGAGKTQFCVKFPTGADIVLATQP